jgi:hypothetical protein
MVLRAVIAVVVVTSQTPCPIAHRGRGAMRGVSRGAHPYLSHVRVQSSWRRSSIAQHVAASSSLTALIESPRVCSPKIPT